MVLADFPDFSSQFSEFQKSRVMNLTLSPISSPAETEVLFRWIVVKDPD